MDKEYYSSLIIWYLHYSINCYDVLRAKKGFEGNLCNFLENNFKNLLLFLFVILHFHSLSDVLNRIINQLDYFKINRFCCFKKPSLSIYNILNPSHRNFSFLSFEFIFKQTLINLTQLYYQCLFSDTFYIIEVIVECRM